MTTSRIGIAGIGLMGHGIARNILKGGWQLTCLDHPGNQPVDDLLAAGATLVGTGSELASQSDIIILCVTGSPQVEEILTRAHGILSGLRPGTLVIDCSTAIPDETLRMAQFVQDRSGRFIDAPMTRTPKEAEEGRLNLIVGGSEDDFNAALPLMRCFAENIFHAGPVSSGHKLKLLHNYVSLGFSAVLAEAAACANRGGIAPAIFTDVLARGGGAGVRRTGAAVAGALRSEGVAIDRHASIFGARSRRSCWILMSSDLVAGLRMKSNAPSRSAAVVVWAPCAVNALTMIALGAPGFPASCFSTPWPSSCGISRSRVTTSGRRLAILSRAITPLFAAPTTSTPGMLESTSRTILRYSAESSTTSTRRGGEFCIMAPNQEAVGCRGSQGTRRAGEIPPTHGMRTAGVTGRLTPPARHDCAQAASG